MSMVHRFVRWLRLLGILIHKFHTRMLSLGPCHQLQIKLKYSLHKISLRIP